MYAQYIMAVLYSLASKPCRALHRQESLSMMLDFQAQQMASKLAAPDLQGNGEGSHVTL